MRTRSKVDQVSEDWSYQQTVTGTACPGNTRPVATHNFSGTAIVDDYTETMRDVVTPNFVKLAAHGKIINNPMDRTIVHKWVGIYPFVSNYSWRRWHTACNPDAYVDYDIVSQGTDASNFSEEAFLPEPTVNVETMKALAISRVWANVQLTEAQALVVMAEGKKTVTSLYYIGTRLLRICKRMRRLGLTKKLAKQLTTKDLIDQYMELRYLIRPLIYDICDFYQVYKTWTEEVPRRITFRKTESVHEQVSQPVSTSEASSTACGMWTITSDYLKSVGIDVTVRAGILTEPQTDYPNLLKLGLGVSDLLPAAWELVPFSFVVDWFLNVSDILGAWNPKLGFKVLASWVVVDKTVIHSNYCTNIALTCAPYAGYSQCSHTKTGRPSSGQSVRTIVRTPNPSRPIFPTFRLRLDTLKLVDLAIILRNIFRS